MFDLYELDPCTEGVNLEDGEADSEKGASPVVVGFL